GGDPAFHDAVADDLDRAADHRMALVRLADVHQHMSLPHAGGEGVALRRSAHARSGFGIDAAVVGQAHAVVAGLPDLALVGVARAVFALVEGLGVAGVEVATGSNPPRHRQHRHLPALLPAAGTGQEGMAEPPDLRIVVAPARIVRTDRTYLDLAERGGGAGEGVAIVLGADEGVHHGRAIDLVRQDAGHRQ